MQNYEYSSLEQYSKSKIFNSILSFTCKCINSKNLMESKQANDEWLQINNIEWIKINSHPIFLEFFECVCSRWW